jgi:hypothetical protein
MRDQARGAIVRKTVDMRNLAVRSPVAMGLAGAIVGVAASRLIRSLMSRTRSERIEWNPAEKESGSAIGEIEDRAGDALESVKDKLVATAKEVGEKLPSIDQVKGGVRGAYRWTTAEQPAVGGLVAAGIGLALGFLLPVSAKEKQALAPVKERVVENLGELEDKVRDLTDRLDDKIAGESKRPKD